MQLIKLDSNPRTCLQALAPPLGHSGLQSETQPGVQVTHLRGTQRLLAFSQGYLSDSPPPPRGLRALFSLDRELSLSLEKSQSSSKIEKNINGGVFLSLG